MKIDGQTVGKSCKSVSLAAGVRAAPRFLCCRWRSACHSGAICAFWVLDTNFSSYHSDVHLCKRVTWASISEHIKWKPWGNSPQNLTEDLSPSPFWVPFGKVSKNFEFYENWILSKMRFWSCEFCQNWYIGNVNVVNIEIS